MTSTPRSAATSATRYVGRAVEIGATCRPARTGRRRSAPPHRRSAASHEGLQPLAIGGAHPPQVPLEVAARDELREHHLLERRRVDVGRQARPAERLLEIRRHDQEAEAQRGKQVLAKLPT